MTLRTGMGDILGSMSRDILGSMSRDISSSNSGGDMR